MTTPAVAGQGTTLIPGASARVVPRRVAPRKTTAERRQLTTAWPAYEPTHAELTHSCASRHEGEAAQPAQETHRHDHAVLTESPTAASADTG